MSEQLLVAIFPTRKALVQALDGIKELDGVDVHRLAVVVKAQTGELRIVEDDVSRNEGIMTGGAFGAALMALGMIQLGAMALPGVGGLIALGAGALAGGLLGGLTGRFAAYMLDLGFRREQIDALAARLQAGKPALMLQFDADFELLAQIKQELIFYNAELIEAGASASTA